MSDHLSCPEPPGAHLRRQQQGQHLVVCDGDIEHDGQAVASAVATFAIVTAD